MSVKAYALIFTKLSKYTSTTDADPRARMSKFVSGTFDLVVKKCLISMLLKEMDFSFMVHAQQIEEEKLKEKTRYSKRARTDNGDFSHSRSGRGNHSQGNNCSEKMVSECW
ncbi:hypothetical protein KY289_026714 [Solanum tuberosum]|nr:hypothetical protein KY289_026714 [Solanum tuberosum]